MEQLEDMLIALQKESYYKKFWFYGTIFFGFLFLIAIGINLDHIALFVIGGLATGINYRFAKDAELKIKIVEKVIEIKNQKQNLTI